MQYTGLVSHTTAGVLLQQLSRVFKSLRLALLEDLVRPLDIVGDDLERLLMSSSRLQRPALLVDRAGGFLVFGSPATVVRDTELPLVPTNRVWLCGLCCVVGSFLVDVSRP